ncbi:MAG TPA: hypothetical protein VH117_12450 [Edaphobacter sp.]|jgi:hypothetical protein|nr:hypothetical protein [Edaphobacter sp.]
MSGNFEPHVEVHEHYSLGRAAVFGVLALLVLIAVAVARHPASVHGDGSGLLWMDVTLLLMYGAAGVWAYYQGRSEVNTSLNAGARFGVPLGVVLVANHVIELFVPVRPFLLVIIPVFLALTLLGAAGSAAWQRIGKFLPAVIAGVWCAIVAVLILLCVGFSMILLFERKAELQLSEAFAASGMNDPGAFLVRNTLEAASEILVRMPIFAVFLSFTGAITNAWISAKSPRTAFAAAWLLPIIFAAGAVALWHANSLERGARPPFVMAGVALSGVTLCSVHAIWSALRRQVGA